MQQIAKRTATQLSGHQCGEEEHEGSSGGGLDGVEQSGRDTAEQPDQQD